MDTETCVSEVSLPLRRQINLEVKYWAYASEKLLHMTAPSVNVNATHFPLWFYREYWQKKYVCKKALPLSAPQSREKGFSVDDNC